MKPFATGLTATLLFVSPAWAQTWGSDYNMGSIGVHAGTENSGTITLDCAETGNAFVEQGALSIIVRPPAGVLTDTNSPGDLSFNVDGQSVSLPVSDNLGDGFVYEKTPETLAEATTLIGLLRNGEHLFITSEFETLVDIPLDGAATALEGTDTCLAP
jgi:hypothetical protein